MDVYDKLSTIQRLAEDGTANGQLGTIMLETIQKIVHVDDPKPVNGTTPFTSMVEPPTQSALLAHYNLPNTWELKVYQSESKIQAIKEHRTRTGLSLKESKEAIELAAGKLGLLQPYDGKQKAEREEKKGHSIGQLIEILDKLARGHSDGNLGTGINLSTQDWSLIDQARKLLNEEPIPF